MNLELLAADIAHRVPELARETPTNRAEVIKGMIQMEVERISTIRLMAKNDANRLLKALDDQTNQTPI